MKVKRLNGYDEYVSTGEKFIAYQNWVIKDFDILLGNNFTMYHFVNNLPAEIIDFIYSHVSVSDSVRLIAKGKYGLCILNTCGNDLFDFLRVKSS